MERNRNRSQDTSELPKLYDIFLCEVATLQPYGIFVKIPGYKKNGLVHKSQMSKTKVEDPSDMVEPREKVYCKVIAIDKDTEKIGMSMKVVNQTSGQDLDPGHVQTALDEQRRKTGHVKEIPRIELGAVLDTTCKKCGGKGHLAQDCFHRPGSKSYDLLPALEYLQEQVMEEKPHKAPKKEKKLKKKKKKKKKKHKRSRQTDTDSESDSDVKKRKHKRRKKVSKRESTSASSESSRTSSSTDIDGPSPKKKGYEDETRTHRDDKHVRVSSGTRDSYSDAMYSRQNKYMDSELQWKPPDREGKGERHDTSHTRSRQRSRDRDSSRDRGRAHSREVRGDRYYTKDGSRYDHGSGSDRDKGRRRSGDNKELSYERLHSSQHRY